MAFISIAMSKAVLTILAGILILIWPKMFRLSLGIYLIIIGILQIFG